MAVWCTNSQIYTHRLETCVLSALRETLTDTTELKKYLIGFDARKSKNKTSTDRQMESMDQKIAEHTKAKESSLTLYARGEITYGEHAIQCKQSDTEIARLKNEREKLLTAVPVLHRKNAVDASIKHHTNTFRARLEQASDFDSTRQLLRDYIKNVIFTRGKIEIHGLVPVQVNNQSDSKELPEIEFNIKKILAPAVLGRKKS